MDRKPKTLYWYENRTLMKHKLYSDCMPYVVTKDADSVRWRCRAHGSSTELRASHDHYGYASLKEAKADEMHETRERIAFDTAWLLKLKGKDD